MTMANQIAALVLKDIRIDFRKSSGLASILLFVIATVFIVYLTVGALTERAWLGIFWVVILFSSVNVVLKDMYQDLSTRRIYLYTLTPPIVFLLAKVFYHYLVLILMTCLAYISMYIFFDSPVQDIPLFTLALSLGLLGISVVFSFLASLGGQGGSNSTLLAVLGFPCAIGVILSALKISLSALTEVNMTSPTNDVLLLAAVVILLLGIGMILFPFTWKE